MARLYRSYHSLPRLERPVVATIGNFDGVHRGHQSLLDRIRRRTRSGGTGIAISFYPHPAVVLGKADRLPLITTLEQKLHVLGECGIDVLLLLRFSKAFSRLTAQEFVQTVLLDGVGVDCLVVGEDARVGHKGLGDAEFLKSSLAAAGREIEIVSFVDVGGERVSSRRIRELLAEGRVREAGDLLGRPYTLRSRVVRGAGRGGTIGIPTANLAPGRQQLPMPGVYATWANVSAGRFRSVTNVGARPTFGGSGLTVETHLIGYGGPALYGDEIDLEFSDRLRDERKFESVADLVAQIRLDIGEADSILRKRSLPGTGTA